MARWRGEEWSSWWQGGGVRVLSEWSSWWQGGGGRVLSEWSSWWQGGGWGGCEVWWYGACLTSVRKEYTDKFVSYWLQHSSPTRSKIQTLVLRRDIPQPLSLWC